MKLDWLKVLYSWLKPSPAFDMQGRIYFLPGWSSFGSERKDPGHGERGADFAATFRGRFFDLPDEDYELFRFACIWHTEGEHHDDPTIGTCWDADRLDLGRVGMIPNARFMSTAFGKEIADHGVIHPWLHLAEACLEEKS